MQKILKFWLNRGASGFRIDATPHLYEVEQDAKGYIPDEPLSGTTANKEEWNYLSHVHTVDKIENIHLIYQFREILDEHQKLNGGVTRFIFFHIPLFVRNMFIFFRVIMTEAYSPINVVMQYYGDGKRNGSHIPFNFKLLELLSNSSSAFDYQQIIGIWMNNMPAGRSANWVVNNYNRNS